MEYVVVVYIGTAVIFIGALLLALWRTRERAIRGKGVRERR
jgi:HAMP domain-containing protein